MKDRIKELRKTLGLTQEAFGNYLGITNTAVSKLEKGENNVTEQNIQALCLRHWNGKTVNEKWLRTGEGEMFVNTSEEEVISDLVYELLDPKDNDFYIAVLELIRTYKESSPDFQLALRESATKFMVNFKKRKGD